MNGQQMVEHLGIYFAASAGKVKTTLPPGRILPKAKAFLWSDKEFRENTSTDGLILKMHSPRSTVIWKKGHEALKAEVQIILYKLFQY